jgi:flagellar basal-body rod protein FlgC
MASDLFGSMSISGAGMTAQRKRMDAIAKNLANAETTRTPEGGPYKRHTVVLRGADAPEPQAPVINPALTLTRTSAEHLPVAPPLPTPALPVATVQASEVVDPKAGVNLVFDPSHPDAGADGYVKMPDIDTVTEMVDMVAATRAYEANLSAMKAYQNIVTKSLEI